MTPKAVLNPSRCAPRLALAALAALFVCGQAAAQAGPLSPERARRRLNELLGLSARPALNYATRAEEASGAAGLNFYGPELFSSFNGALPYGQNDGALWQGRGLNARLRGGAAYRAYGLELSLLPELAWSQNLDFTLMPSAYESEYGYIWSYGSGAMVDAPQRFGDASFLTLSWGDSELRYAYGPFTVGFGTQLPWLGPSLVNPLLHSNTGVPYPKLDLGVRRTPLRLFGWLAGELEARLWAGRLGESEYFDTNPDNDYRLISGLSLAYAPSFMPGLSLFANRSFLAFWEPESAAYIPELFLVSLRNAKQVQGSEDQRAGLGFSYLLPAAGFEAYGELGLDDYVAGTTGYIRYPFHTIAYTAGLAKAFTLDAPRGVYGLLAAEIHGSELSQDFQFQWPSTFYGHHQLVQGYTSGGQWLGPGAGTGGNAQYLGFTVFHPRGSVGAFIYRVNPDNDFLYKDTIQLVIGEKGATAPQFFQFKASLSLGVEFEQRLNERIMVSGGLVYDYVVNPRYEAWTQAHNLRATFGLSLLDL